MCIEDHFPYICYRGQSRKRTETTFCKNSKDYETCRIVTQYIHPLFTESRTPQRHAEPSASTSLNERDRVADKSHRQYSRDRTKNKENLDPPTALSEDAKRVRFDIPTARSELRITHRGDMYHPHKSRHTSKLPTRSIANDNLPVSSRSQDRSRSDHLRGRNSGDRNRTY